MYHINIIIAVITAYLVGSIPFGLLIAKSKGIDLRKAGSGNIGATNVFRTVGKGLGLLTFALDALKGFGPACFLPALLNIPPEQPQYALLFGCAAIVGHNWPVFLRFKGGKGVATSAGVLLAVAPLSFLCGIVAFALILKLSGYVSAASMTAALLIAGTGWVFYLENGWILPLVLTLLALLVILRHRSNIQRLMNGTENKIRKTRK